MVLKNKSQIYIGVQSIIAAAAFILLSIPAFSMTGLIIKPLILCAAGSMAICSALCFLKNRETVCGISLLIFVCFWTLFAFYKQIELQILEDFPGKWINFFYFDKFLMVGTIWFSATLFFSILRLMSKFSRRDYKLFYKFNSVAFLIFYIFLLVYSFVLIRLEKGNYPMNRTPFSTINEYIKDYSSIPYEVFMMFFGNLLYFTPMGMIFYLLLKEKHIILKIVVIAVFPIVAFSLLEYSQFLLQNGFCEFDDMMMNSAGFWLGALLGFTADKLIIKITHGRLNCFWN